jgi:hypothetical protein
MGILFAPQGSQLTTTVNVDGWFLEAPVREVFAQGKQNDVPLIVGSNPRRSVARNYYPEDLGGVPATRDEQVR